MADRLTGQIDCDQHCPIPDGVTLVETPPSRHAWSDVVRCPNDGCEKTFLVVERPDNSEGESSG